MSSTLLIEAADRSGRWYLLPGAANSYELTVRNQSDHSLLCKLTLEEPVDAGCVTPASLTLNAGESRTVAVAFKPEWLTLRDRKAMVCARNAGGTVLATFVQDLVAATTTDCSVSLGWKDEIEGNGVLRGFTLSCTVRSISSTPGIFEPAFAPHPSLHFPETHRVVLGPGETSSFDVPVIWNRSARDAEGWNHPRTIEVGVPVTHGRRTATAPWDVVQQHIEPYLTDADRAPVIARRPASLQFRNAGGTAPAVSPVAVAAPLEGLSISAPSSQRERMARARMEAGITTAGGPLASHAAAPRSTAAQQPQAPAQPASSQPGRETISVAPATLMLIGIAFGAISIVLVLLLKLPVLNNAVATSRVMTVSPPLSTLRPRASRAPAPAKFHVKNALGATQAAAAAITAAAAPAVAAGENINAPAAQTASSRAARAAQHRTAQAVAVVPQRVSPVDHSALVQLGGVGAEYVRGGRMVRVSWDAYAQAGADVQLLDDQSKILSESTVGRRLAVVLRLPRGYRGDVYVQVTAIGYHGERVVGSTSLGAP